MNEKAARAYRAFLEAYGLDLQALGMEKTPARVAELYEVLLSGVGRGTKEIWGEVFASDYHGLLTVTGLQNGKIGADVVASSAVAGTVDGRNRPRGDGRSARAGRICPR